MAARVLTPLAPLAPQQLRARRAAPGLRRARAPVAPMAAKGGKGGKGKQKHKQGSKQPKSAPTKKQQEQSFEDRVVRQFMFTLSGVSKSLPDSGKKVLDNISLSFFPGAKIGIVGKNGSGKSTLLRIMAGVDTEFDGLSQPNPNISVGYLPQEPVLTGPTVKDEIDKAVEKGREVIDRWTDLSMKLGEVEGEELEQVSAEFERLQNLIDASDLWEIDRRVERAKFALRCPPDDADVAVLSGGEQRRVALAKLLLEGHDLLLLDEPTNHLDCTSVTWLERFLSEFQGTIVSITHDRYWLQESCQWILELDRGKGIPFEGNYGQWLEHRAKRFEAERKQDDRKAKAIADELEWVNSTPKARQAKSKARLKKYDELVQAGLSTADMTRTDSIFLPNGPRLGNKVLSVSDLSKSYGDRVLFQDVAFDIPPGAVVGVIGGNGVGKSTLMKILQGKDSDFSGTVDTGETVKLVTVDQMREGLTGDKTVFEEITDGSDFIKLDNQSINSRAYCSWFGFTGADQQKRVENLSGGEKNRLHLGKIVRAEGNVILLDEPTNDLDVWHGRYPYLSGVSTSNVNIALKVIANWPRICTHIIAFEGDSQIRFFEGNWTEYEEDRIQRLGDDLPKPIKFATLA